MKEKIKILIDKAKTILITYVKPALISVDGKINTLIPNPKIKKLAYIGVGSLFGFMFLIIFIGILVSPLRNRSNDSDTVLKKPNIIVSSPEPQKELNDTQKEILKLENEINNITFPESELNIPVIERGLTI